MINSRFIKVCGMLHDDNIQNVEELDIDMMGFIFYSKSPRNVTMKPKYLPSRVERVGVFVNSELEYIQDTINEFSLNIVQLHGEETPTFCKNVSSMGVKVIKAFQIATVDDFNLIDPYFQVCDYLLFDTKSDQKGGTGKQFDWHILDNYKGSTPFILSGGIDIDSPSILNNINHPMLAGYDLNSKFEEYPSYKSIENLELFINKLKLVF